MTPHSAALQLFTPYSPQDVAVMRLCAKLALRGATVRGAHAPAVTALWQPYCLSPVDVRARVKRGRGRLPMAAEMRVPCRKCERCLQFRRLRWRQRIFNEIQLVDARGARSWFCTLTFSPLHLAMVVQEAQPLIEAGRDRAAAIEKAAYRHVQLWLKRVRKNSRARFRYFAVPEYGENTGRLHYHVLLHEVERPVHYVHLKRTWHSRVFEAVLVDCESNRRVGGLASYLAKYLTKASGRPRASERYGHLAKQAAAGPSPGRSIF